METWYMIIILMSTNATPATVEFMNEASCKLASERVLKAAPYKTGIAVVCVKDR